MTQTIKPATESKKPEGMKQHPLMGTICGDIIGVPYERPAEKRTKDYHFEAFAKRSHISDDTIFTLTIAEWLMGERTDQRLIELMRFYGRKYWRFGFSRTTLSFIFGKIDAPYNSNGNGAAMRVGAIAWAAQTLDEALDLARQATMVTHNTDEAVRGAQAVTAAIFLNRTDHSKNEIREYIESHFGYDLSRTPEQIRPDYTFSATCDGSVPQAICCWLYSDNYEQAVRNAVSLGGDADTQAAIAGSIAIATPGWTIPQAWYERAYSKVSEIFRQIMDNFAERYDV